MMLLIVCRNLETGVGCRQGNGADCSEVRQDQQHMLVSQSGVSSFSPRGPEPEGHPRKLQAQYE